MKNSNSSPYAAKNKYFYNLITALIDGKGHSKAN